MNRISTKKLTPLFMTSALALVITACAPVQENSNFTASSNAPNLYVEDVLAGQGDLTMFYQALRATGVMNELNDDTEYTIFAPNNAVFAKIKPRAYPCFYDAQCRPQVAAILRNHIVPRNESIDSFSKWGRNIATLGNRRLDVEEPYKGRYTVEGYRVLYQNENKEASRIKGNKVSIYHIDGLVASAQEMERFRTVPVVFVPAGVMERTTTTYRTPIASSSMPQTIMPNAYLVPGGYASNSTNYTDTYEDASDSTTETTTVTHTTTK